MNKKYIGLCRARTPKSEDAVYGYYWAYDKASYCFEGEAPDDNTVHKLLFEESGDWGMEINLKCADILPETLQRFTGCWDKNGHMVYEGDKLKFYGETLEVIWDDEYCKFAFRDENNRDAFVFNRKTVRMCEVVDEKK